MEISSRAKGEAEAVKQNFIIHPLCFKSIPEFCSMFSNLFNILLFSEANQTQKNIYFIARKSLVIATLTFNSDLVVLDPILCYVY